MEENGQNGCCEVRTVTMRTPLVPSFHAPAILLQYLSRANTLYAYLICCSL